jgi:hypothetical protein
MTMESEGITMPKWADDLPHRTIKTNTITHPTIVPFIMPFLLLKKVQKKATKAPPGFRPVSLHGFIPCSLTYVVDVRFRT